MIRKELEQKSRERNQKIGARLKEMGIIGPKVFDYFEPNQPDPIHFTAHSLDFDRLKAYYQEQVAGKENEAGMLEAVERFTWYYKFLRMCLSMSEEPFQVEYNEQRGPLIIYSRALSGRETPLTAEEMDYLIRSSKQWGYSGKFKQLQLIGRFQQETAKSKTLELLDWIEEEMRSDLQGVKADLGFRIGRLMG